MNVFKSLALVALIGAAASAAAQTAVIAPPQNVLQLSASGTVEVQQDLLNMTLVATREGADAASVQGELKAALDTALAEARKAAQPGKLDVHTGNFNLSPRYTREGKISTWQGRAELVLEGADFALVAATAGRINTLNVGNIGFGLSRPQREKAEAEAQKIAIDAFGQKANELAKGFGFSGYTLREVSVNASQGGPMQPRMMAMAKSGTAADSPVPVEAGKANVVVNISGSVQLTK